MARVGHEAWKQLAHVYVPFRLQLCPLESNRDSGKLRLPTGKYPGINNSHKMNKTKHTNKRAHQQITKQKS